MRELGLVSSYRGSNAVLDAVIVVFQVLQRLGDAILSHLQRAIGLAQALDIGAGALADAAVAGGAGKQGRDATQVFVYRLGQLGVVQLHRAVFVERDADVDQRDRAAVAVIHGTAQH
ncbi:hypothetical protein D9M68_454510 [compost metagenome]